MMKDTRRITKNDANVMMCNYNKAHAITREFETRAQMWWAHSQATKSNGIANVKSLSK